MNSESNPKDTGIGAADARSSFKPMGTALVAALGCAVVASSAPGLAAVGVDSTDLREAVSVVGIRGHQ